MISLFIKQPIEFVKKKHEASNIYTYYFKKPPKLKYRAGQHFILSLSSEIASSNDNRRIMSASAAPSEELISFTTRFLAAKGSAFKQDLHDMRPGQHLFLRGPSPMNDFFKVNPNKHYLFIIGGMGITPLRAVLKDAANAGIKLHSSIIWQRKSNEVVFGTELTELAKATGVTLESVHYPGKIDESFFRDAQKNLTEPTVLIAGNPGFTEEAEQLALRLGVPKKRIKQLAYKIVWGFGKR